MVLETEESVNVRRTRILLVVAAAALSVAASGSAHAVPGRAGTAIPAGTTMATSVGENDTSPVGTTPTEAQRSLRVPPGDSASEGVLTQTQRGG